ncbi:MAG: hypothetical protein ABII82_15595 [Verrucomicrobiota bacterium]
MQNKSEMAIMIRDTDVDLQVSTAKQYPRSVSRAITTAKEIACLSQEMAESCIYAIPRAGKTIDGPSVRLAEIVASCWGNARVEGRPFSVENDRVLAEATYWDLEQNVAFRVTKSRRITDKNGRRFNDDMIEVTMNAAVSVALRDAIFRGVPKSVVEEVYLAARETAVGKLSSLAERRDRMVKSFAAMGITEDRILFKIGKVGLNDIGQKDLAVLIGLHTQLKEGADVEEVFPDPASIVIPEKEYRTALRESAIPRDHLAKLLAAEGIRSLTGASIEHYKTAIGIIRDWDRMQDAPAVEVEPEVKEPTAPAPEPPAERRMRKKRVAVEREAPKAAPASEPTTKPNGKRNCLGNYEDGNDACLDCEDRVGCLESIDARGRNATLPGMFK